MMNLKHLLILCLTGLVPAAVSILQTVPHRFELNMSQVTWSVAQNYCREIYTDLAIILSPNDWLRLNKVTKINNLTTPAWVGLYNDINSWRWSLHDLPLKNVTYTNWGSGEPNNGGGKASCVAILAYGVWADLDCSLYRPCICYNANFTGASKFIGIPNILMTWLGALQYCRLYYTDLASALNSTDNNYLWSWRNALGDSWIGLYRDTWKWADGMDASNLLWASNQPDNYGGNENCASVQAGLLSDETCSNIHSFFCYTNSPVRGQILKLQLRSNGSVFDPPLQSIIDLIKQKLDENSMLENTTVNWRVPPDGQIIRKKNKDDL